jgi:hypothetical protein
MLVAHTGFEGVLLRNEKYREINGFKEWSGAGVPKESQGKGAHQRRSWDVSVHTLSHGLRFLRRRTSGRTALCSLDDLRDLLRRREVLATLS